MGPISIPLKEMPAEEANTRGVRTLFTVRLLSFFLLLVCPA